MMRQEDNFFKPVHIRIAANCREILDEPEEVVFGVIPDTSESDGDFRTAGRFTHFKILNNAVNAAHFQLC